MILVLGERVARSEISVEAHDVLLGNLRAYLGDKAAEQQRTLDDLEDAMRGRIETPRVFVAPRAMNSFTV
jgi:hypothetical protein